MDSPEFDHPNNIGRVSKQVTNAYKRAVMNVIGVLYVPLGSSTLQVSIRCECAYSETGFSSQNGDRAWGVYYRSTAFLFCVLVGKKDSMQNICIKKCFPFTMGSIRRVKRFTSGSRTSLKDVRKSQMMPDHLREVAETTVKKTFDALIKRRGTCINVLGGYVEK
jgi:hypothetical protein